MSDVGRFARHMSDEDALMWNIEKDPVLRSTIVAVAIFDSAPDWVRLRRRIDRATLLIPPFRQRVLSPPPRTAPPRPAALHHRPQLRPRLPSPPDTASRPRIDARAARDPATDRDVELRPRP